MKNFILIGVMSTSIFANAQNKYPEPTIDKINYNIPDKKHGIQYYLPITAQKTLDSIISGLTLQKDMTRYFIVLELSYAKDTVDLYGYFMKKKRHHFHLKKDTDNVRLLSKSTNRFIVSGKLKIPLVFESDFMYAFTNFAFGDSDFYIKFIGGKLEMGKVIFASR